MGFLRPLNFTKGYDMEQKILAIAILMTLSMQVKAQNMLPGVVSGKIERLEHFQSRYVSARNIDIWLPEGYSRSKKYAVLYMHDGQMLYDSTQSWNKQSWDIDEVATDLTTKSNLKEFIVVGIWNSGQTRHQEYFPQKPFEQLTQVEKDSVNRNLQNAGRTTETFNPKSNAYLRFIVKELKPYIDRNYTVYTDPQNTFIAGSSMGGLISMYAICTYPKIFGGAACLSTHWVGTFTLENNPIPNAFIQYLSEYLPDPGTHKLYFDCGDRNLDALYPEIQKKVDRVMQTKGYTSSSWVTKYFPGEDHNEKSWNKRLHIPLEFLMQK